MEDGGGWRWQTVEVSAAELSRRGNGMFIPGTTILWYSDGPTPANILDGTRMYTVTERVRDDGSSNTRARVADDDATLRWQLPEVKVKPGDGCAICLGDLAAGSEEGEEEATPRAMPCLHAFHERCIFQWVRKNRECPLCRRPLPTPQQQEYDYSDDDRLQLTVPVPREMLQIEVI